jgi:hypothetical protein
MIEKYLRTGIRFKWNKPLDGATVRDGQFVDSTQAATNLVYDGLDGKLGLAMGLTHPSSLGLTMGMKITYDWLDYAPGRIAKKALSGNDVLTGSMTGCIIAVWTDTGRKFVGHVGTISSEQDTNSKVKSHFATAMAIDKDAKGFDPFAAWPTGEIVSLSIKLSPVVPKQHIFALVTNENKFYSILMLELPRTPGRPMTDPVEWCSGGIKEVNPTNCSQIAKLTGA